MKYHFINSLLNSSLKEFKCFVYSSTVVFSVFVDVSLITSSHALT
ncbi:MAG: hypothetical protein Q8S84_05000 [bacterium]|nr:hypothetical protein [bacterium]